MKGQKNIAKRKDLILVSCYCPLKIAFEILKLLKLWTISEIGKGMYHFSSNSLNFKLKGLNFKDFDKWHWRCRDENNLDDGDDDDNLDDGDDDDNLDEDDE